MDKELMHAFTRRLSQCNKGEMIVITYEICFAYLEDAKQGYKAEEHGDFKQGILRAQRVLRELMGSLDFKYPIAGNLYQLYRYCNMQLSETLFKNSLSGVKEAEKVLRPLYSSFVEAAKQDTSEPLMQNIQQVYAGMTYGKGELTENYLENDVHRGFLV